MKQDKTVRYHVWNKDEDLMANVNAEVIFPDGGRVYTKIGQVAIKKGDALHLDYGRSMGVYTMSGRGYEAEFKHGKVSLHGCAVYLELAKGQSKDVNYVETTKEEFDAKVENQKSRVTPEIEELKEVYVFEETKLRVEARARQAEADKRMKDKVKNAVSQMTQALEQQAKARNEAASKLKLTKI